MLTHLARYFTGKTDPLRVAQVNESLLYPSTPLTGSGVLYLDGEGMASAYIAQRGADLFLTGKYNKVIIAGGRKPVAEWKRYALEGRMAKDGQYYPGKKQTEAKYIAEVLRECVEVAGVFSHTYTPEQAKAELCIVNAGNNTGEKIRLCRKHFEGAAAIQAVTASYVQNRVHGTLRKELGDTPVISVEGVYPLGFTRENWNRNWLSCAVVMDEADKTLPGLKGEAPKYADFFRPVDIAAETARINAYKAGFGPK